MTVFSTERLLVRFARSQARDIDFLYQLWTNPEVMKFVGFPNGLKTTREQIAEKISVWDSERGLAVKRSPFDIYLLVEEKSSGALVGECKLGAPDKDEVSETDVKLAPEFWGQGYGVELKQALLDYLFTHTTCAAVKATPNDLKLDDVVVQRLETLKVLMPVCEK